MIRSTGGISLGIITGNTGESDMVGVDDKRKRLRQCYKKCRRFVEVKVDTIKTSIVIRQTKLTNTSK